MKLNSTLQSRYLIQLEMSNKGGRRTFLAQDQQSQETVIIKIIQFGAEFEWVNLKLFEREAEILQNVDHPAIPKYKDYFETEIDGVHSFVLVQTHIEAISLESAIRSGRTFSKAEVLELAERLLEILKYLHEQAPPIVHRDIKPSNILITYADSGSSEEDPDSRSNSRINDIYLIDFGSVHTVASQESGTITIVGSYGYIPLEQFAGQAVPASDLYSLGMTLIYLITGIHPAEIPQVHGQVQIDRSRVSPKLARWLERMTHPYIDQRFDSANTALIELKAKDSGAGYYQHLKPADSRVDVQRDCDRLTITFDRTRYSLLDNFKDNPAGYGCLLFFAGFPFLSILITLFSYFPVLIAALLGLFLFRLLSRWVRRKAPQRKVIIIDRNQGICSDPYGNNFMPGRWNSASSHPFKSIKQLAYNPGYTFDHYYQEGRRVRTQGGAVTVPPKLSIYAGTKEYQVAHRNITQAEFWWLGKELSDFLGLDLQAIYSSPEIPIKETGGSCGCGC